MRGVADKKSMFDNFRPCFQI